MVEKIDEKDAVTSVRKACETNNVALLVQMLPETYGHFNAASALVATKLDNFEAFKVIGEAPALKDEASSVAYVRIKR